MDIRKTITILLRLAVSSDYRFIRRKKVFDPGYYLASLPDDDRGRGRDSIDPLWDFLKKRGNDFSPEISQAEGWCHLANPHPLFDIAFYLLRYFPEGLSVNPFVHYLRQGWRQGLCPGPYFEPDTYKARSSWTEKDGDPLTHFTHIGSVQGISPGLNFDSGWYHDRNPVLAEVQREIIKHYKLHGAPINKSPLPVFAPEFYRDQAEGAAPSERRQLSDPFAHFVTTGAELGLCPSLWFDPDTYLQSSGARCGRVSALADYVHRGVFEGHITDARIAALPRKPVISLVVPVYNPDLGELNNCIRSVLYQAYPNWQLCLADDCSTAPGVRESLEMWAAKDSRIRITFLENNLGISGATNSAAEMAEGEYVGFLDNDDELTIDCLYKVVEAINSTGADLVYSDEDLIGDDGTRLSVFRKPDYNSALLLSHNYITHFVVVARQLFLDVGGFASEYDGAQDFDMMLKLTEVAGRIQHIPEVLYHWRASQTSTSINHSQKDYAHEAGKLALAAALKRRGLPGTAADTGLNFFYRLQPVAESPAAATQVVVIFKDPDAGTETTLRSLQETLPANCSVVILHPGSGEKGSSAPGLDSCNMQWLSYDSEKGFAAACNRVADETEAGLLVFVLGDAGVFREGWLPELQAALPGADGGLVCGRVSVNGGDGTSYSLPDLANTSPLYFHEFLHHASRHVNGLHCPQMVGCCGWDMTMVPKSLFLKLGGFDVTNFPHLFGMADFSRRVSERGGQLIYTPEARLDRHEAVSGSGPVCEDEGLLAEKQLFQRHWQQWLLAFEPMYNVGVLADNSLDLRAFRRWLTGQAGQAADNIGGKQTES